MKNKELKEIIEELLKQPEGLKFDFKVILHIAECTDKSKQDGFRDEFVRDILALVNGNIGTAGKTAYLIVGAADKLDNNGTRKLQDSSHIRLTNKEILQKVNPCCNPPIPDIQTEFVEISGTQLFVICIPPTPYLHETTRDLTLPNRKTYPKNSVFIRHGEEINLASIDEIDAIRREKLQGVQPDSGYTKANGVMSQEEKKYLESIKQGFQDWWVDSYIFMNEINDSPWQELELTVKIPKSKLNNETNLLSASDSDDKTAILPILDALSQVSNGRVLIVGKAGAGKSTILAKVLLNAAKEALQNLTSPIPVLIKLKDYQNQSNFLLLIRDIFERFGFLEEMQEREQITYIKKLIKDKRLLLIADGVNELSSDGYRDFKYFCGDHLPMIATTRDINVGNLGIQTKLEIQPLSAEKVKDFFSEKFPDYYDNSRVQELCDRVRDFGQTPLMVWMLYIIFKQNPFKETPNTRGEAYREFTDIYSREAKDEVDWGNLYETREQLSLLAFEMTRSEKLFNEGDVLNLIGREKIRKNLFSNHLLQWDRSAGSRKVQFCHPSLQEYYAAEYLLTQYFLNQSHNLVKIEEFKQEYLNHLKWTEVIALMFGFIEITEEQSKQLIELSISVDLFLGARLVGEAQPDLHQVTVNIIIQKRFTLPLTIRLLEKTRSPNALPFLLDVLKNGCSDTRWRATRALSNLTDKAILRLLIELLHDHDSSVRRKAVESLGKLGNVEAIPHLYKLLNDNDWLIRSFVVEALGNLEDKTAINCLKNALEHEDYIVRTNAAQYLGQRVPYEVAALLSEKFANADSDTKRDILILLGETKNAAAIPTLVHALSESDWIIRSQAVDQIGLLGIRLDLDSLEKSLLPLVDILQIDPEASIRSSAALALGWIGDLRVVPNLIKALSDENQVVRSSSAIALGCLQSQLAINSLINSLEDIDYVQESSIKALRALNATKALPAIRKLAHSKVVNIRREAIYTLGFIGDSKDLPYLYKALEDKDFAVSLCAACSLSQLNNRKGIPTLENALKRGDKAARKLAFEGLKDFNGKVGLSIILSSLFKEDDYSLKKASIDFLESFKEEEEVMAQLTNALNSKNEEICRNAMDIAKMLGNPRDILQLRKLAETIIVVERPLEAISAIQSRCQFYNYEIANLSESETQKTDNLYPSTQGLTIVTDKQPIINFNQNNATIGVNYAAENSNIKFQQNVNITEQDLAIAAQKIQAILNQLTQIYPTTTEIQKQDFIHKFLEMLESTPDLIKVILAGGIEWVKALFPLAGIPIEMSRSIYEAVKKRHNQS